MKKTYSKPDILFESFSLATSIAAGCDEKLQLLQDGVCGVKWGQTTIFTSEIEGCKRDIVEGDSEYNGLCYHNPSETYNVFMS